MPSSVAIIGLNIGRVDPISRNTPLAAILLMCLFGLTAVSLGYVISHLFEKQETANSALPDRHSHTHKTQRIQDVHALT